MTKLLYANTKNSDMLYRIGFDVPDAFFLIETDNAQYVFLDSREYGVFKEKNKNPRTELVLLDPLVKAASQMEMQTSIANKLALYLLQKYELTASPVQVPAEFPVAMADFLRANGVTLQPISPFYPERLVKRPQEVDAIRESLRRTQEAFKLIEAVLRESRIVGETLEYRGTTLTSEWMRQEVERVLLEQDMLNSEGMIISCGPHAAIPHHPGSGALRPHTTIICDIFPRHRASGYFADMTRTYVKGTPSDAVRKMYAAVQAAQETAMRAIKPGMNTHDAHHISVDLFAAEGYESGVGERGFCHGTGHGLGLDVHEDPFLRATHQQVLEQGNVITIEPGLYYPEHGGVRIEDVVVVTADGCENLTQYHKEYLIP